MKEYYTREEVAQHNSEDSFWMIIDGKVYDVTVFASFHPGGEYILKPYAGKDATNDFYALHRHEVLEHYGPKYQIGTIKDEKSKIVSTRTTISTVPYAESSFWQGSRSPYFNDSHKKFKKEVRKFFNEYVVPEAREFDEAGKPPSEDLFRKCGEFGLLASRIGPGWWLEGRNLPGGVSSGEFDYFHELIAHEEIAAMGYMGYADGLACGMVIGLPPVLHFGKPDIAKKVVNEVLSGEKRICLSITEPFAGSDVANIQTTAVKSADGKHYIVNGVKKWITNGMNSEYFSTAVRTGGPGIGGISMLLIPRSAGGLRTKPIKTGYSSAAGTAYVIMEDVKVPAENLLGEENQGFKCIMYNFNHERWLIVCQSVRASRLVVEECFKWAVQRQVFGKPLISQPVIRFKLANMIAEVEAIQNWLESITYQMCKMSYKEQSIKLAGPIALLKFQSTRVGTRVADQACQIFGGRAISSGKWSMGRVVQGYLEGNKFAAILGGSEEIMADLGMKQAIRFYPSTAKL